jgi:hypothetical protein
MRERLRFHLTYANVMSTLGVFLILGGGVAYAANTVFSSDIVDNQVYSADVRNDTLGGGGLAASDLSPGSVGPSEATGLTGADIADAASGSDNVNADKLDGLHANALVHGRGTLLSNRIVIVPPDFSKTLLVIPGLGELKAYCFHDFAAVDWVNTTSSTIDKWVDHNGSWAAGLVPPSGRANDVANSDSNAGGTLALGLGNDPGPRRIATVQAFAFQEFDGFPCGFQAQATLWTSG